MFTHFSPHGFLRRLHAANVYTYMHTAARALTIRMARSEDRERVSYPKMVWKDVAKAEEDPRRVLFLVPSRLPEKRPVNRASDTSGG